MSVRDCGLNNRLIDLIFRIWSLNSVIWQKELLFLAFWCAMMKKMNTQEVLGYG